jgi:predicted ATPase/DNA-binding winged helix-turn-helix (wHTH) protein
MSKGIPELGVAVVRFGKAELDRGARELVVDGKRAPLGPRGIALLTALVDARDRTLSKQELLDTVWRGVVVEENNLQVQISTLRRLLGPQAIATIPGRGYRFMLPIEGTAAGELVLSEATAANEEVATPSREGNLSASPLELIGREAECAAMQTLLLQHPLVSVVGAAGIGKTRLAIAAAHALQEHYKDGVWVVELATLNDLSLLVQSVARAVRMALPGMREPMDELATALRGLEILLVIDNCEHLVDEVGTLVARLLKDSNSLRIMTTSQEPLKVVDEHVFRLGPLEVPSAATVDQASSYGALHLFIERARSYQTHFKVDASTIEDVIEICRRLDGMPLAIELAAARVPLLGVAGVRERLGERFRILTGGSRFAPKRHQTLRAALDWSHALLNAEEQAVYRRLGVFVGTFSLESAQELAESDSVDSWAVLEHLGSLVDKSLVIAGDEVRPRYRMLESTREHALEQLALAHETDQWIARHARVTQRAVARCIKFRRTEDLLSEMTNVRSAYEWARRPGGDPTVAVALATLPSMVIAVEGAVQEARQRLLEVESLVTDAIPASLVAQYWQWYGRIGLDGRLPTSRCIAAFRRSEQMFVELGNSRHVHACRRHLAEAMMDANDLAGAEAALARARAMETAQWPLADRVRRLRVEGLLLARRRSFDEALRTSTLALEMAQRATIDRYELVLLDDIARMHLEAGHAHEAAIQYRALAERAQRAPNAGLTLSNALAGLIAALTTEDRLDDASIAAVESLPILRRSGILLARSDVLAFLMARRGQPELAARLLGASDRFRADCEAPRDPLEDHCREQAREIVFQEMSDDARLRCMAAGASIDEVDLVAEVTMLARLPRA